MDGTGIDAAATPGPAAAPLVMVTGAGGFIGVHLVRALREAGFAVRPVTRNPAPGGVAHPGVGPDADWGPALAGADAVVHLAGMAHLPLDSREMRRRLRRINVESTRRLAHAAAAQGVCTFIFMSSIKAIGDHSTGGALTEASPPRPEDCYGMAKLAAERRLQRIGRGSSGMRILVLRPPLVYGPGVRANFAALVRWAGSGLPLPLGGIRNRRSLIYVGNLTSAVVRCLQRRDVPSGTFHLSDDAAVTTPDLVRAIAGACDRRVRLPVLPVSWLRVAAKAVRREAWLTRLVGSLEVSNAHFCRSFDWRPPFSLDEGLRETLSDRPRRPAGR